MMQAAKDYLMGQVWVPRYVIAALVALVILVAIL